MGLPGALAAVKVAQQYAVADIDLLGYRQVDDMTIARRHVDLLALAVLQLLQLEAQIALGGHQLQAVAQGELVFDLDLDQAFGIAAGDLTDKLLAVGDRIAVVVVLILVVGMAAQAIDEK